eukprot:COSAG05_NODE_3763_length_1852_cov_1.440388_2_plen_199_part_00
MPKGGGVLVGVNIHALIPKVGENTTARVVGPRTVVLDAPNIAMRHGSRGNSKKFSAKGIEIATQYYQKMGHTVVGLIPDYMLSFENTGKQKMAQKLGVGEAKPSKLVDDVQLLQKLCDEGTLVGCPPQDYDDSYTIVYAKSKKGAVIVTNDMYRDNTDKMEGRERSEHIRWFKEHLISYTFVGDDFVPNPDFEFPQNE